MARGLRFLAAYHPTTQAIGIACHPWIMRAAEITESQNQAFLRVETDNARAKIARCPGKSAKSLKRMVSRVGNGDNHVVTTSSVLSGLFALTS